MIAETTHTDELTNNNAEGIEEIEREDTGYPETSFDPDKIRVDHQNTNLGYLIEKLQNDQINLTPELKNSVDLWSLKQRSQLIESLLLGLPLPFFYFCAQSNKWVVVDGLQMLWTLNDFIINNEFELFGLEFLTKYNGKNYDSLSNADKRRISGTKIYFNLIERPSPSYVKFLIFKRVNTELTAQEIRHTLNHGIASGLIEELAGLEEFKQATDYLINSKRMEDREFANRFVAFYILGYDVNYKGELDNFLNDGLEALAKATEDERAKIKEAFRKAMALSYKIFGSDAFRKRQHIYDKRAPISKPVFDTISINLAWLTDDQQMLLHNKKGNLQMRLIELFNDDVFYQSVTVATGRKSSVQTRFELIKNMLNELLAT
ncbi:DUF262 domain-containing protein [Candidatus Magnetominusculus dajiuhuensis]|uniref:DUF262 domain-containing protein n=1 Tax=Candidatus Magnetominusculus dajiuhuensis TaxID=3137712 RepID=UPI003B4383C6